MINLNGDENLTPKQFAYRFTLERGLDAAHSWRNENYPKVPVAIGIRVDEFDRQSPNKDDENLIYPLVKLKVKSTK